MELGLTAECWLKTCGNLKPNHTLILYYISSRLLALLNVIDAPIQVPKNLDLTVFIKFLNFSFEKFLLFMPEISAYVVYNVLHCLDYLHCVGFDPVTTAF